MGRKKLDISDEERKIRLAEQRKRASIKQRELGKRRIENLSLERIEKLRQSKRVENLTTEKIENERKRKREAYNYAKLQKRLHILGLHESDARKSVKTAVLNDANVQAYWTTEETNSEAVGDEDIIKFEPSVVGEEGDSYNVRSSTQLAFHDKLAYFVCIDGHGLEIIEGEGFKQLMYALSPMNRMPSAAELGAWIAHLAQMNQSSQEKFVDISSIGISDKIAQHIHKEAAAHNAELRFKGTEFESKTYIKSEADQLDQLKALPVSYKPEVDLCNMAKLTFFDKLAYFVCMDKHPFEIIEGAGFKYLMQALAPTCRLPRAEELHVRIVQLAKRQLILIASTTSEDVNKTFAM